MNLSELFDEELVFFNLEAASSEELLTRMARELEERKFVKESYKKAIIAREHKYPTGLPTEIMKVAIPHTDIEHVNKSCISITKLKVPVYFHQMGDHNQTVAVELVLMIALNDGQNHLNLIQQLIGLFSQKEVMWNLQHAGSAKELLNIVLQGINAPTISTSTN
ncbi:PTS sugar transporter subunit IIA [Peribacillus frigoritolerans]|uniref:PTS sugar transporter subunit IIA n=1 Tax=Peribacillus frigoritolerans TaxID=450367 RepID=UPI003F7CFD96